MQLIHSHKDDVIIDGKPGVLLSRTGERALVKFDSGAVTWMDSADVPLTEAERAPAEAAPATLDMLRDAGTMVRGEGLGRDIADGLAAMARAQQAAS